MSAKTTKSSKATKKPAAEKPAAKKPAAKKPAAEKPAAKKPAAKKPVPVKTEPAAKKPAPVKKEPAPTAETDVDRSFAPFVLMAPGEDSTMWSLFLADAHSPEEVFDEEGHSGNGYSWDSVARVALRDLPEHADAVEFDSEAGTFVAMSDEKAPLVALGGALKRLLDDEEALRDAIRSVPEEDWDD